MEQQQPDTRTAKKFSNRNINAPRSSQMKEFRIAEKFSEQSETGSKRGCFNNGYVKAFKNMFLKNS